MTTPQRLPRGTVEPNTLSDQTAPNTLKGMPRPAVAPSGAGVARRTGYLVLAAVVAAILILLLTRR